MAQALIDSEGQAIVRSVIDRAKDGDMQACRLVVERLIPPRRERSLSFALPEDLTTAAGLAEAASAILLATAAGELLPSEATALAAIIETRRRAVETMELEQRIAALEGKQRCP